MNKWIKLSLKQAIKSTYKKRFRHGAVLVKGGKILNVGWNSRNYSSLYHRFSDYGIVHAEFDVLYNIHKNQTSNATIYVARINSKGETCLSKPCKGCYDFAKFCGIKKIIYSINKELTGQVKL